MMRMRLENIAQKDAERGDKRLEAVEPSRTL